MHRSTRVALLAGTLATLTAASALAGQRPALSSVAPAARFADPQRLAKLSAAFPQIDQLMREFAERQHVPGIAYGIIVDGRPLLFRLSDLDAVSPLASDLGPTVFAEQVRSLLLETGPPLDGGRYVIYGCPECEFNCYCDELRSGQVDSSHPDVDCVCCTE